MRFTAKEREELLRLEKQIPHKGVVLHIRIILALDLGYTAKEIAEKICRTLESRQPIIMKL